MVHSFVLIGQSNMAGRGHFDEVEPIKNDRIKVLRNGRWQPIFTPVNPDRPFAGVNLAESFAEVYAEEYNVDVGLIPCADGGTSLEQWSVGGLLYDNAVYQSKLASRTSVIKGVLWHQGEADCGEDLYPLYEEKFVKIMSSFREDLKLYDVPFLLGGLGDFLKNCEFSEDLKNYYHINKILEDIANKNYMTGFVPADGLSANIDNLHFNAKSLREFGMRYYHVFKKIAVRGKSFSENSLMNDTARSKMEWL